MCIFHMKNIILCVPESIHFFMLLANRSFNVFRNLTVDFLRAHPFSLCPAPSICCMHTLASSFHSTHIVVFTIINVYPYVCIFSLFSASIKYLHITYTHTRRWWCCNFFFFLSMQQVKMKWVERKIEMKWEKLLLVNERSRGDDMRPTLPAFRPLLLFVLSFFQRSAVMESIKMRIYCILGRNTAMRTKKSFYGNTISMSPKNRTLAHTITRFSMFHSHLIQVYIYTPRLRIIQLV